MAANNPVRVGDYSLPWYQLRGRGGTLVSADDTPLDLVATGATNEWADKPSAPALWPSGTTAAGESYNGVPTVAVNIPETCGGRISTIEIIGYGTDTADDTMAWILYAYRGRYSPAIRVAAGSAILGTYPCSTDPVLNEAITSGFYVDTWGQTSDYWGVTSYKDDADNTASRMMFDLRGYQSLYLEVDIGATGVMTTFGAAFSGV